VIQGGPPWKNLGSALAQWTYRLSYARGPWMRNRLIVQLQRADLGKPLCYVIRKKTAAICLK